MHRLHLIQGRIWNERESIEGDSNKNNACEYYCNFTIALVSAAYLYARNASHKHTNTSHDSQYRSGMMFLLLHRFSAAFSFTRYKISWLYFSFRGAKWNTFEIIREIMLLRRLCVYSFFSSSVFYIFHRSMYVHGCRYAYMQPKQWRAHDHSLSHSIEL